MSDTDEHYMEPEALKLDDFMTECRACEDRYFDTFDDDLGLCWDCRVEREHLRQLKSDYYSGL